MAIVKYNKKSNLNAQKSCFYLERSFVLIINAMPIMPAPTSISTDTLSASRLFPLSLKWRRPPVDRGESEDMNDADDWWCWWPLFQ